MLALGLIAEMELRRATFVLAGANARIVKLSPNVVSVQVNRATLRSLRGALRMDKSRIVRMDHYMASALLGEFLLVSL